jgi:hypothetical protein
MCIWNGNKKTPNQEKNRLPESTNEARQGATALGRRENIHEPSVEVSDEGLHVERPTGR